MKKFACLSLLVFLAILMVSCAKATSQPSELKSEPIEGMINPGDKIGDFLITTGEGEEVTYNWELDSVLVQQGNEEIFTAQIPVGTKMNVSWGVYAAFSAKDLDTLWSEHTYKMFIDNYPVNLEAFGSIDVLQPQVGKMRHWNVVIVATKPGEIAVRSEGIVDGEVFGDTKTYTFSTP